MADNLGDAVEKISIVILILAFGDRDLVSEIGIWKLERQSDDIDWPASNGTNGVHKPGAQKSRNEYVNVFETPLRFLASVEGPRTHEKCRGYNVTHA